MRFRYLALEVQYLRQVLDVAVRDVVLRGGPRAYIVAIFAALERPAERYEAGQARTRDRRTDAGRQLVDIATVAQQRLIRFIDCLVLDLAHTFLVRGVYAAYFLLRLRPRGIVACDARIVAHAQDGFFETDPACAADLVGACGIDRCAVAPHLEVEMRTCGVACRPDLADDYTLPDHITRLDVAEAFEMSIARFVPVGVLNDNEIAVAALVANELDLAIG